MDFSRISGEGGVNLIYPGVPVFSCFHACEKSIKGMGTLKGVVLVRCLFIDGMSALYI